MLKRTAYSDEGKKVKEGKTLSKVCKKFNVSTGDIDQKIPIT